MANPLALKALRLAAKGIKHVAKKLKNQTKFQTKGISFRPKPGDGSKNYAQKLDYLVKTSPVKVGKKRAAWANKKGLSDYPHTPKGKMIRNAADKYNAKTLQEANQVISGTSKKLVAGESNPTSRLLANSKAYGERGHMYKSGQALTGKAAVRKTKSKNALTKAFNSGNLSRGQAHDPFRVVRGKGKKKGGTGLWVQVKKNKVLASVVPAVSLSGKKKKKK